MATNNKNQRLGVKALEERVEKLRAELAGVADEIAQLEKDRADDMLLCQRALDAAHSQHALALDNKAKALAAAEDTERKGNALIAAGRKLLTEAAEQRVEAEKLDLQLEPVRAAERLTRERQEHWKNELARIQSSATRRKRAQLEQALAKLERRVARKVTEPEVASGPVPIVPRNTGTGRIEGFGKVIAEQPMAVLAGLLAGAQKPTPRLVPAPDPEPEAQPEEQAKEQPDAKQP
jgi:hypothetical protein